MKKRKRKPDTFACPHCGAEVRADAVSCRECGSDAETGWSEDAHVWDAGLSAGYGDEDDFDYDEFVEREFPESAAPSSGRSLRTWAWRIVAVLVCIGMLRYICAG